MGVCWGVHRAGTGRRILGHLCLALVAGGKLTDWAFPVPDFAFLILSPFVNSPSPRTAIKAGHVLRFHSGGELFRMMLMEVDYHGDITTVHYGPQGIQAVWGLAANGIGFS